PSATLQATQDLFTRVSVQYRSENYFHDVLPGQDPAVRSRDGWNVRTGFDQFWLFNHRRSYARLSYHYDTQRNEGSDWDYNGHERSLGGTKPPVGWYHVRCPRLLLPVQFPAWEFLLVLHQCPGWLRDLKSRPSLPQRRYPGPD